MRDSKLDENLLKYLHTYILKKGESIDRHYQANGSFIDLEIIRSTKRTFRKIGMITIGTDHKEIVGKEIDYLLKRLKLTPRKKLSLNHDDPQTLKWLENGWILKEIRLKQDGRTVASQSYRMSYRLFKEQLSREKQRIENITVELHELKNKILLVHLHENQPLIKQKMLQNIRKKYIAVSDIDQIKESKLFPQNWPFNKRMKFLHFMLAFLQLGSSRNKMDWKEIGASYYQTIGGSKVFDRNQQEFLDLLEEWSSYPAIEYGLISLGHITPVFFSGQVTGRYSTYDYGPVHSVTNISVGAEQYQTKATTLWIVENRGILTRIAAQSNFLQNENVLMVCSDGHIRSAHRNFISQILHNSDLEQAIIWTDYDQDGTVIAQDLFQIIEKQVKVIKWIGPGGDILYDHNKYMVEMSEFLEQNKMEQEEMTGDESQWKRWIDL